VPASEPVMTAEEREAANLVVEAVGGGRGGAGGGGRGGRGGNGGPALPQEMNAEFAILLGQHKTALEIRDFLSGEFTPLPLADLMAVLRARESAGSIKLAPKTGK
jgi:aminopeptidase YwaD